MDKQRGPVLVIELVCTHYGIRYNDKRPGGLELRPGKKTLIKEKEKGEWGMAT